MLEICQFRPEEIEEAIAGMDGLQQVVVPVLLRAMMNGMGTVEDVQQFLRHIMLAKHALIAMGDFLQAQMGGEQSEQKA